MSFRFRRSIKIAPGFRLNLGKCGVSVSAGVRGAKATFGGSGIRTTVGLPGSGLSITQKVGTSSPLSADGLVEIATSAQLRELIQSGKQFANPVTGRRYSHVQLSSLLAKLERKEEFTHNSNALDVERDAYEKVISIGKRALAVPTTAEIQERLKPVPFKEENFTLSPPTRVEVQNAIQMDVYAKNPSKIVWLFFPCILAVIVSLYGYLAPNKRVLYSSLVLVIGFFVGALFEFLIKRKARKEKLAKIIVTQVHGEFQRRTNEFESLKERFFNQMAERRASHDNEEQERIEQMNKVLAGDLAVMNKILEERFSEMELPVETEASFDVVSPSAVYLDVDLPEIEDCVRTTLNAILKSGKVKGKPKPLKLQKQEYVAIVTGLGFYLASETFAACPGVDNIIVSGYTQRVNKRTGNVDDDYVYSINIDKKRFSTINFQEADPIEAFKSFNARWKLSTSYELGTIEPFNSPNDVSEQKGVTH